ncbi:MAG: beta-galactosidase [Aggregatilineales bacterium]
MTHQVEITERKIWVDDQSFGLLSGEIHYWRLAPEVWRDCLRRIKEMGISIVATYICWDFHEIAPGAYDFDGHTDPRRNLIAFLELVAAENLWLIIRPGPYIYSEWRNGGVPDHAAVYHRLHPEFQAKALDYMRAVVPVLLPHLATNGGRILMLQSDNEIDPWPHWYTEALGLGATAGSFQEFLRESYDSIETLNRAWQTAYPNFESARATSVLLEQTPAKVVRYLDTRRFRYWYVEKVARWGIEAYRQLGIDVPICLNTYSGVGTQSPADLEQFSDLVGADLYPSREFALRTEEHRFFMDSARYLSAYSKLPYIAEFGAGIWHDWLAEVGIFTPNHYRLISLSALLSGIVGWNWYMLVNRDNWAMSPINEWGRTRPDLFAAFQQITTLFNTIDPPALTRLVSSALTLDPLQTAAVRPAQDLWRAFYESGIDHAIYDPNVGSCAQPILFYAGTHWLSTSAHERLAQYVDSGGHLIFLGGSYPHFDSKLAEANTFKIPEPAGVVDSSASVLRLRLGFSDKEWTVRSRWLAQYAPGIGRPIYAKRAEITDIGSEEDRLRAGLQVGTRYQIGYSDTCGKGQITVIGLPPSPGLLLALHAELPNAIPPVRPATPDTAAGLFRGSDALYLIVVNNGEEGKGMELELGIAGQYQAHDLLRGNTFVVNTNRVFVSLPRKDGTVLRLTPVDGNAQTQIAG